MTGYVVTSGISTPGAYTKTANLVTGTFENIGEGDLFVYAKASAVNINITCIVGGVPIVNDQNVIFQGTSGTLSKTDNQVTAIHTLGGRVELYLRNTGATAGTTCDYQVEWLPSKSRR